MALNFPNSPSNGDTAHGFTYNSTKGVWENQDATVSDTAPSSPRNGEFWFDSTTAKLYMRYEDGSSNQWVTVNGAAGADGADGTATVYANTSLLPTSGNSVGAFAFATLTKSVHVWDGAEWDRISSGGDENPRLTTTPATTHDLNSDGTNTAITIVASDPEGFPITYSHDTAPASPNQVTNVVENNGVFTLVPSTNSAHAGSFTLRLKASDGVNITSHAIAVSLSFNTTFTFDTSSSVINTNYTTDNKVEATVSAGSIAATSEQSGKLGKGYFEFKCVSIGGTCMLGVQVGTNTGGYGASTGAYAYASGGGGYPGGSGTGASFATNDIVMVAYDTAAGTNGQVWFGKNGSWVTGKVPGTDAGYDVGTDASTAGFRPAVHEGAGGASTHQLEIQTPQYTLPTGWSRA